VVAVRALKDSEAKRMMESNLAGLTARLLGSLLVARKHGILVVFVLLTAALSLASSNFLTWLNLLNTVEAGSIYGIVALALTILLIVGEFDFCSGATFVLAGIVTARLEPSIGTAPALTLGLASAIVVGSINGVVVAYLNVNSFVATLGTSLVVVGIGTLITNGFQLYIPDPSFRVLGNGTALGVPFFVWIFFGLAALCGFVLKWTSVGQWLYACGGNREAARLLGIDTQLLRFGAFVFSGFAAGLAGAILVSRTATAIAGNGLPEVLFPAVTAVVVGGTSIGGGYGAVWRTMLGVLFLEFIRNGYNLIGLNSYYQGIVQGTIILVAVTSDALSRRTA
jgi:ribose transport system permease protein